ncbi:hypothetical protein BGZ63DRAFT_122364 [Mariannaea sp. PMI_226]|nr:hypothetical protein BGZ63DRAFT_122364 [Mariannaea sp. PMI_226]
MTQDETMRRRAGVAPSCEGGLASIMSRWFLSTAVLVNARGWLLLCCLRLLFRDTAFRSSRNTPSLCRTCLVFFIVYFYFGMAALRVRLDSSLCSHFVCNLAVSEASNAWRRRNWAYHSIL